eukprot:1147941-Pelagomonas_calceolata.AAC.6
MFAEISSLLILSLALGSWAQLFVRPQPQPGWPRVIRWLPFALACFIAPVCLDAFFGPRSALMMTPFPSTPVGARRCHPKDCVGLFRCSGRQCPRLPPAWASATSSCLSLACTGLSGTGS